MISSTKPDSVESLKSHLRNLSSALPSFQNSSTQTSDPLLSYGSTLATISNNLLALLLPAPHPTPTLYLISTTPTTSIPTDPTAPHQLSLNLPSDARTLVSGQHMLAVLGPRSITIIDTSSKSPIPRSVASSLFLRRPSLKILDAVWSPHAPAFLLVLTSDSYLRLYDVVSEKSAAMERNRLKVVTAGAEPVSITFGRGTSWNMLAVYVLASDGNIYVAAPFAPIGTRMSKTSWQTLYDIAQKNASKGNEQILPNSDDNKSIQWALQQAQMQLRFLQHVFEPSADSGDMVAVREFKPAPLLFQGPLFVEHDDVQPDAQHFSSLLTLNCGHNTPPILLRTTSTGEVSILLALERVEAQWFLHPNLDTPSDAALFASEEYADCAKEVAPLLLAFEHLSFEDGPIQLSLLGGKTDSDILFAVSPRSVYAVRLSFASVLANIDALEKIPCSSISELFSTRLPGTEETEDPQALASSPMLMGLAPVYARGEGPVAVVITSQGELHTTSPIRWIADFENISNIPPLLDGTTVSESAWTSTDRPITSRKRVYACPKAGEDVTDLLEYVQILQRENGAHLAPGTLGKSRDSTAIEFLEDRLAAFTGADSGAGISDTLKSLAEALGLWSDELRARLDGREDQMNELRDVLNDVEKSEDALKIKLGRVEQVGVMLSERLRNVRMTVDSENSNLSAVELERFAKLKEKKKRLAATRKRIEELSSAVEEANRRRRKAVDDSFHSPFASPARHSVNVSTPNSTGRRTHRWSVSPAWRDPETSIARRRSEWSSPRQDSLPLSRKELQQIKVALEKHSKEIAEAMEMSSGLWKRLAVN